MHCICYYFLCVACVPGNMSHTKGKEFIFFMNSVVKLAGTVNQLNFAAVKFRVLTIHALFRATKFHVLGSRKIPGPGQPCFTKVAMTPLIMVRFSKFKVFLKLETKAHNILRAI